jgi:hypothetical protein
LRITVARGVRSGANCVKERGPLRSFENRSTLLPQGRSVIIRVGPRALVVEEVGRIERRGDRLEGERRLWEVETIGQVNEHQAADTS